MILICPPVGMRVPENPWGFRYPRGTVTCHSDGVDFSKTKHGRYGPHSLIRIGQAATRMGGWVADGAVQPGRGLAALPPRPAMDASAGQDAACHCSPVRLHLQTSRSFDPESAQQGLREGAGLLPAALSPGRAAPPLTTPSVLCLPPIR